MVAGIGGRTEGKIPMAFEFDGKMVAAFSDTIASFARQNIRHR
jgi:hypothetical protein